MPAVFILSFHRKVQQASQFSVMTRKAVLVVSVATHSYSTASIALLIVHIPRTDTEDGGATTGPLSASTPFNVSENSCK